MSYCSERHSTGWLCVLKAGHEGDHMSIDNASMWKGTPGKPVFWPRENVTQVPTVHAVPNKPSFTGIPCEYCESMNTIQNGKCRLCLDCKQTGECG